MAHVIVVLWLKKQGVDIRIGASMLHLRTQFDFPIPFAVTLPHRQVFALALPGPYALECHGPSRDAPFHALGYHAEIRLPAQHVRYIGPAPQVVDGIDAVWHEKKR